MRHYSSRAFPPLLCPSVAMAATCNYKTQLLETCRVGPPPGSLPHTSLPLTAFDVVWLVQPPVQRLFFYQFPQRVTATHFVNILLPKLKRSLSLSLRFFFPFAGNLTLSPVSGEQQITYVDGDSVSLTICQSNADFWQLAANHPRCATEFHPLVPQLPKSDPQKQPLLALQVTVFPDSGICIGTNVHHVVADGSSYMRFMKAWAAICRLGDDTSIAPHPTQDRAALAHLGWLKTLLQDQMTNLCTGGRTTLELDIDQLRRDKPPVLSTFVMNRADIQRLRRWVLLGRQEEDGQKPFHCSAFVLTTAYVCVCLSKLSAKDGVSGKAVHFAFSVDCRVRLEPPISATYFGNCISCCKSHMRGSDLTAEDGIRRASEAIGKSIEALGGGVLIGAENWITSWASAIADGDRCLGVAGSPKFRVYETDFGFGKPTKVEIISIAETGAISLAESRDEEGGIEVGIALPLDEMEKFTSLFEEGFKHLSQ
ncbi:hypothetical protein ACLOJK_013156 [Asimina triloba]